MSGKDLLLTLSTHGANLNAIHRGGTTEFTSADIAAATAHLPARSYLYAMYYFLQQEQHHKLLSEYLYQDILLLWEEREWKISSSTEKNLLAARMALLAIDEKKNAIFDQKCGGTGIYRDKPCRKCEGTGKLTYTHSKRYNDLQIKKSTYHRLYKDAYQDCLHLLASYEQGISQIMEKQLIKPRQTDY